MHEGVLNSTFELILVMEGDGMLGRMIQNAEFDRGTMSNVLRINRASKISNIHSAVFPEELVSTLINAFSTEGDTVLDPFMGSGTTAKMAILTGRNYIGFETSEEYCRLAEDRIHEFKHQTKLF